MESNAYTFKPTLIYHNRERLSRLDPVFHISDQHEPRLETSSYWLIRVFNSGDLLLG
jgi:hypothetical protein